MTTRPAPPSGVAAVPRSARTLLTLAAVAVAFAAADTYVVVLALVDMMQGVGLSPDQLQKAAPIVSGFLLGYVAMLPLIGRIADLRGRGPVLVASLGLFAVGSLVTAASYDLQTLVLGRFLQGVGGGGLVPATLALVADLYPRERRGVPLGVVSAVQEIGSVLGPLLGAAVLAVADWRAIFGLNLAVGLVLAASVRVALAKADVADGARGLAPATGPGRRRLPDPVGLVLVALLLVAAALVVVAPPALVQDVQWGRLYIPTTGLGWLGERWSTPVGLVAVVALLLLLARCLTASRPLVDLRAWGSSLREADVFGAALLGLALAGVILAFATADPKVEVFSPQGRWYLLGAGVAAAAFLAHLRRAESPLLPRGALRATPAWGSLVVSLFVGAALVAALIDIPLFARTTIYQDSQLLAALVLVRFLIALPVGAILGGWLTRTVPAGTVTAVGMILAAGSFYAMAQWDADALRSATATLPLVIGGLGFGLALAPVNAAVLASTDAAVHGLASALVVVARMVGMLVGISALTTLGLRRYYAESAGIPPAQEVCGGRSRCDAYTDLLTTAGIAQEHTVFLGAALCALVAAAVAVLVYRRADTRTVSPTEALAPGA
ncbi:MFS transporter [Nocardioides sp. TRM66260-LWL]|uniref:MFS transporter n=1 Tax=Nocardioides sp. TRM66260-LWL TaxID=2874478 RepID=UPI001CC67A51|nr:MFS transporter [Nocardioides sp. TRM66260-LWL]MBZ5733724.1 MFS transporter [Nocardioides sp. TRM66260-LWL]